MSDVLFRMEKLVNKTFPLLWETTFDKPENILLPTGETSKMIYDMFGGFKIKTLGIDDTEIVDSSVIKDNKIFINFFDILTIYTDKEVIYISDYTKTIKILDFDRIDNIINTYNLSGAEVSIDGAFFGNYKEQLKSIYPKLSIKSYSYFLDQAAKHVPTLDKTIDFDVNISCLLAARPDVHKYWLLSKLNSLDKNLCNITQKIKLYGDLNTWNRLLFSLTGEDVRISTNRTVNTQIPGDDLHIADEPLNIEIYHFLKLGAVTIVPETVFFTPLSFFTEKTFHPIASYRPFILVAPAYTLKYIKELGFKTFDKWWDESYDLIEDPKERMLTIFQLIDKISKLSKSELKSMLQDMQPVLDHNIEVLKNFSDIQREYFLKQC